MAGWAAQLLLSRVTANQDLGDWEMARSDLALLTDWDLSELHAGLRATGNAFLAATIGDTVAAAVGLAEARENLGKIDTLPQVGALTLAISLVHVLLGEWPAALNALQGLEGGGNESVMCQFRAFAAAAAGERVTLAGVQTGTDALDRLRLSNTTRAHVNASVAATSGSWDEARSAYAAAAAEYRALGYNLEAALLGLESAAYLGDRYEDAFASGEAAKAWFGERGGTSVVERYRAAFKGTPAPPAGAAAAAKRAVHVDAEQPA
jgi:hypothetical protein